MNINLPANYTLLACFHIVNSQESIILVESPEGYNGKEFVVWRYNRNTGERFWGKYCNNYYDAVLTFSKKLL